MLNATVRHFFNDQMASLIKLVGMLLQTKVYSSWKDDALYWYRPQVLKKIP
jgi:hypothetical protein